MQTLITKISISTFTSNQTIVALSIVELNKYQTTTLVTKIGKYVALNISQLYKNKKKLVVEGDELFGYQRQIYKAISQVVLDLSSRKKKLIPSSV